MPTFQQTAQQWSNDPTFVAFNNKKDERTYLLGDTGEVNSVEPTTDLNNFVLRVADTGGNLHLRLESQGDASTGTFQLRLERGDGAYCILNLNDIIEAAGNKEVQIREIQQVKDVVWTGETLQKVLVSRLIVCSEEYNEVTEDIVGSTDECEVVA